MQIEQTPYLPVCIMVISRSQSASDVQWGEAERLHPKKVWVKGAILTSYHEIAWNSKRGTVEVGSGRSLPELCFICQYSPCSVCCGAHLANCCCCWKENIYFPSPSALPPASLQPLPAVLLLDSPQGDHVQLTKTAQTYSFVAFFFSSGLRSWISFLGGQNKVRMERRKERRRWGREGVLSPSATPNSATQISPVQFITFWVDSNKIEVNVRWNCLTLSRATYSPLSYVKAQFIHAHFPVTSHGFQS